MTTATQHTHRRLWCEANESSASAHGHVDNCYRDEPCWNPEHVTSETPRPDDDGTSPNHYEDEP